jgi:hypothetical protein
MFIGSQFFFQMLHPMQFVDAYNAHNALLRQEARDKIEKAIESSYMNPMAFVILHDVALQHMPPPAMEETQGDPDFVMDEDANLRYGTDDDDKPSFLYMEYLRSKMNVKNPTQYRYFYCANVRAIIIYPF